MIANLKDSILKPFQQGCHLPTRKMVVAEEGGGARVSEQIFVNYRRYQSGQSSQRGFQGNFSECSLHQKDRIFLPNTNL